MKGRWHGRPYHDIGTGKWLLTFETEEPPDIFDKTRDKLLNMKITEYSEIRGLTANAYFHVLVDKIAKVLEISEVMAKNMMIARYGQLSEDAVRQIILEESIDWRKVESLHLRPTTRTKELDNNKLYRVYLVVRGSHTYTSKEMSQLIDGTVQEAKELGIETMPPDEIERMVQLWKPKKA